MTQSVDNRVTYLMQRAKKLDNSYPKELQVRTDISLVTYRSTHTVTVKTYFTPTAATKERSTTMSWELTSSPYSELPIREIDEQLTRHKDILNYAIELSAPRSIDSGKHCSHCSTEISTEQIEYPSCLCAKCYIHVVTGKLEKTSEDNNRLFILILKVVDSLLTLRTPTDQTKQLAKDALEAIGQDMLQRQALEQEEKLQVLLNKADFSKMVARVHGGDRCFFRPIDNPENDV